jgi:magnesium transporter
VVLLNTGYRWLGLEKPPDCVHVEDILSPRHSIAMQSAVLRSPVPSRSLLRFLRSQTDIAFFNYNCGHVCQGRATNGASGQRAVKAHSTNSNKSSSEPTFCTELEASIFSLPQLQIGKMMRKAGARALRREPFCTSTPAYQKATDATEASAPSWQERLWGIGARKGAKSLKPDDLPSRDDMEHGSSMFNNRRVLSAKAALEPRLRCTEVDENGKVILMDGEFKKTELIAKVWWFAHS